MKKTKMAKRNSFPNTRKAIRKQKRREKKIHRQEHYMKKNTVQDLPKQPPGRFVKRPVEDPDPHVEPKKKKQTPQTTSQDILARQRQKEKKEVAKLNSQMQEQRRKMLVKANEDEDKMIKKLEKHLGLNKTKNKNNYFAEDGLDYLLEICDRATSEQIVAAEKHLANVENESDFEEDLATVTGKKVNQSEQETKKQDKKHVKNSKNDNNSDLENENSEDELSEEEESIMDGDKLEMEHSNDDFDSDNEQESELYGTEDENIDDTASVDTFNESTEKPYKSKKPELKTKGKEKEAQIKPEIKTHKENIMKVEDLSKVFSDDEVSRLSDDGDDLEGFSGEGSDDEERGGEKDNPEKPDVWEDIYGRKRDKEGNVIIEEKGIYIPPHLRNKDSISDKDLVQLKRQIKSVLNKLAGTNLHWACTSIENLYSSNSRNSVNTALCQLWQEATVAPSATPDRMLAEHAALLAVLHANVGSEIGAHFLQELTKRFDSLLQTSQHVGDKTLDNLVACLAHLYSFKIYHATLLYDILHRLTQTLSEKHIECVLVGLRVVGGVMRKEEPLMLRSFIQDTQTKATGITDSASEGSRIKFLLEVLMAVKNNNLTKIPNYDPTYSEQLKKTIRGVIRKGNYVTPLNIRLDDLLNADERGKWWVVGSAWEGRRAEPEKPAPAPVPSAEQALLELARKQRMNTDVRRSVFCTIMAAEDYTSAFEKLEQLGLKGPQQREIAHVVLACCLQEKKYNPYYAVLATKLTETDRKHQLSFQFSIWDKIKELDGLSKQAMANLAQFIVHLVMEKGLALSVLKIIQFSDLTKRTVKFMRQILLTIILNEDLQSTLEAFHRIAKSPKLHMFRESLRLFIQHFLIKNAEKKNNVLSEKEMEILKERAESIDKILTMNESKMMF